MEEKTEDFGTEISTFMICRSQLYIEIGRPKKGLPVVGVRALKARWLRFIWFGALL
jgi:hypothetical protein